MLAGGIAGLLAPTLRIHASSDAHIRRADSAGGVPLPHLFFFMFRLCTLPLLLGVPPFFIPPDASRKMPFTLDTSRSFVVSCHPRTSEDSNLPFIMNKSLHCEKCLLFAPALKTTTGSSHSSCDCFAYFYTATPHRGGN